nr:hypothetical protein [uncultured Aminipila sp.]
MIQKKNIKRSMSLLLILLIITMCSCSSGEKEPISKAPAKNDGVVEITEDLFLTQINDIYTNSDDYLGRKIKYQGIFGTMPYEEGGEMQDIIYVFRNSPGCCGNDGTAGFEVLWGGEMPPQDAWVEVEGILKTFEDKDGNQYLQLKLDSLKVLAERGKEFVSQ